MEAALTVRMSVRPPAKFTEKTDWSLWISRFERYVKEARVPDSERVKELLPLLEDEPLRLVVQYGLSESADYAAVHECLQCRYGHDGTELEWQVVSKSVVTADGSSLEMLGQVTLSVEIGGLVGLHPILVAKSLTQECILGADFLVAHGCVLDYTTKTLLAGGNAVLMEDTCIQEQCEMQVPVSLTLGEGLCAVAREEFCGLLEPEPLFMERHGLAVAHSISRNKNGVTMIQIMNPNPTAIRVLKGEKVGKFHSVDESKCVCVLSGSSPEVGSRSQESLESIITSLVCDAEDLSSEERKQLKELLHRFSDVISLSDSDIGRTEMIQHHINTENAKPVKQAPRRLPFHHLKEVKKLVESMLDNNVIEPSNGPWASPIVLVKKKDGSTRFCVDFRQLNSVTRKDAHPIPRIDETLDALHGACWFSTLDLASGYWQVKVAPEDREKTAFTTPYCLYQFCVMPFGLCNAPSTFQRLMELVLAGLHWSSCLVYLDDIIIYSRTVKEHLTRLEEVLERLQAAGMKLKPKKCRLLRRKLALADCPERAKTVSRSCLLLSAICERLRQHRCPPQSPAGKGALQWLYSFKEPEGQVARWLESLAEYEFTVQHRPGKKHTNADALSRVPCQDAPAVNANSIPLDRTDSWLSQLSKREISPPKHRHAPLQADVSTTPMQRVAMDILGPLPLTPRSNKYVLVIGDYFTKWTEAFAIPDMETVTVARVFVNEFVSRFGAPTHLHTDQGRSFESSLIKELCQLMGIVKTRTTPYHPQSDGMIERFNRTLLSMLRMAAVDDESNWDLKLPCLMLAYRTSVHEATKHAPFSLMFGREVQLPIDVMFGLPTGSGQPTNVPVYVKELRKWLSEAYERLKPYLHRVEHTEEAGPSQQGDVPARETIPPHDVNEEMYDMCQGSRPTTLTKDEKRLNSGSLQNQAAQLAPADEETQQPVEHYHEDPVEEVAAADSLQKGLEVGLIFSMTRGRVLFKEGAV
eukprot:Em0116g11a